MFSVMDISGGGDAKYRLSHVSTVKRIHGIGRTFCGLVAINAARRMKMKHKQSGTGDSVFMHATPRLRPL
jgi:hypothetical protein